MHGMYQGKKILIACSMIEDEINAVFDHFGCGDIEIRWMERGYHNDPDELREVIQNEINRAEADGADTVILEIVERNLPQLSVLDWQAPTA